MNGHDLLPLYVLNSLPDDERVAFDAHLGSCELCQRELASYGPVLSRLAADVEEPPPPALRASVLSEIAGVDQEQPVELPPMPDEQADVVALPPRPAVPTASRWLAVAAALLAFALIAVSTSTVALWRRTNELEQQVAQNAAASRLATVLAAEDAELVDVQTDLSGDLRVAVSERRDTGVVVADDLEAPPEDRVYQLWLIDDGEPRSAGLVAQRTGVLGVLQQIGDAEAVAMSIEPPSGSTSPTGPIVGQAPLP